VVEIGTNVRRTGKPLKRFSQRSFVRTRLKPGVNESRKRIADVRRSICLFSLTPRFSGVLAVGGERKTVSTVFRAAGRQEQ
jgi:hypothetical protein